MNKLEENIGYKFKNHNLRQQALTHPSVSNKVSTCYERLEFLGDAVLNMLITEYIIRQYPKESEGCLAKRKAYLVSGKVLSLVAKEINLGDLIIMSKGEEKSGGRLNNSNLENALEALIGAIFLDGGLSNVKKFIKKYFVPIADSMSEVPMNPKAMLQEWSQGNGQQIPEYNIISSSGPDHSPIFEVEVRIGNKPLASAKGSSKKIAENSAAKLALGKINVK